jgi:Ca2+-binding EF-hand superfamily protein
VLREEDEAEVHYLVRNISRIDTDNSGEVDFEEFANFLLKRHCGELALQRTHRAGRIRNGAARKLTLEEFRVLLDDAYHFLGVKVDNETARRVFEQSDTDRDGLITYQEYFKFIETAICRPSGTKATEAPKPVVQPPPNRPESDSDFLLNFRRLLWGELLRIYNKYDADGNANLDTNEFTLLLKELLQETSQSSLDYVFKNAFRMDINGDSRFIFDEFGVFFIKHISEIGLDRFNRSRGGSGKRTINLQEFLTLFRSSFGFLQSLNINEEDIKKIFRGIDQDRDGTISYKEYLQWTLELLNFREANGTPAYFQAVSSQTFIPAPAPLPI